MKKIFLFLFLFVSVAATAQRVRTTITSDGVNVTITTPVNVKVCSVCDFRWEFSEPNTTLRLWIDGNAQEIIPGGRLGNFTINGATTQATKLAALGAITAECSQGGGGAGGADTLYTSAGQQLVNGDTIPANTSEMVVRLTASTNQTISNPTPFDTGIVVVYQLVNTGSSYISWSFGTDFYDSEGRPLDLVYTAADEVAVRVFRSVMNDAGSTILVAESTNSNTLLSFNYSDLTTIADDPKGVSLALLAAQGGFRADVSNPSTRKPDFQYRASNYSGLNVPYNLGSAWVGVTGTVTIDTSTTLNILRYSGNVTIANPSVYYATGNIVQFFLINTHASNTTTWTWGNQWLDGSYAALSAITIPAGQMKVYTFQVVENASGTKRMLAISLPQVSGTTYTASNGIGLTGSDFRLGGTYMASHPSAFTGTRKINLGGFNLNIGLTSDSTLFFLDGTNKRLGVGTLTPVAGLHVANNGAASTPTELLSGTWFTGGTSTTTKPALLIEPTGTTSTGWSTSGTGLGVNAPSGFSGNIVDLQVNSASRFSLTSAGAVTISNSLTAGSHVFAASSSRIAWTSRGRMESPSDGVIALYNSNGTDFTRLQFGGTTSSFPSLKRSTTNLQVRLADDSAFGGLEAGNILINGRNQENAGADIASANDLTLGADGNVFGITGTTQINAITTTNWKSGSEITLIFSASLTVKHNTAGGGGTAPIKLSGAVDFAATADDVLVLVLKGTTWYEKSRTVI